MHRPLVVTNSLAHGGAEHHAVTLLNRLSARGHDCHVAHVKDERAQYDRLRLPHSGRVSNLHARRYLDNRALERLANVISAVEPSVIVAANEYSLLYATLARRRARLRRPLVVIYHSTRLQTLKERLQMLCYRPLFWNADCAVFLCDSQRRFWRRRGVLARRNAVIANGVDIDRFAPPCDPHESRARRAALGLGSDDFVASIVAGLRPEKNHLQLVDAIRRLRDDGIPARALLIGDGPMRARIERHARDRRVADDVLITGYRNDVRPLIAACNVTVLCSFTETLSLAAIEAMAAGKPCVHSNVGGAAELVQHGWNGYLFEVGDTAALVDCLRRLTDSRHARTLGQNARLTVESRFSEEAMVDEYERLLNELDEAAGPDVATAGRVS